MVLNTPCIQSCSEQGAYPPKPLRILRVSPPIRHAVGTQTVLPGRQVAAPFGKGASTFLPTGGIIVALWGDVRGGSPMLRRILFAGLTVLALSAGRAEAVTIRDIIELSKAGLSASVLLALIEVDRTVFAIDTATIRKLKDSGVSDAVIVAMIRSGREQAEPAPAPMELQDPPPA